MKLKLSKGFDIKLVGKALPELVQDIQADTYSFKPVDFPGLTRPKVLVKEGDTVKAGTPIFFDKWNDQVKFTAPVSGEVVEIKRGARRYPLEIKILADKSSTYESFPSHSASEIAGLSREAVTKQLLESGVWPNLVERPFGLVPKPDHHPKAIFISALDTHPLAPDYDFVFSGEEKYLQAGIDVLRKLTEGKVHITTSSGKGSVFKNLQGVEKHEISGPHPAGNVGVQIHHIDPINKGEFVWTITPFGLQQIGRLFLEGKYDSRKVVALAGSEVQKPQYYSTYSGANIKKFVEGNLKTENVRFITGNVLTGSKIDMDGSLGFHHNMFTVIPEGNHHELFGWILPTSRKVSFHKAFGLLSFLSPSKERVIDTNLHGEKRAIVQSGVFERVLPMDIFPVHLLKSILANDYEEMEALGIYEVIEEDFALCEFVDVSKMNIQSILRDGMEALQQA